MSVRKYIAGGTIAAALVCIFIAAFIISAWSVQGSGKGDDKVDTGQSLPEGTINIYSNDDTHKVEKMSEQYNVNQEVITVPKTEDKPVEERTAANINKAEGSLENVKKNESGTKSPTLVYNGEQKDNIDTAQKKERSTKVDNREKVDNKPGKNSSMENSKISGKEDVVKEVDSKANELMVLVNKNSPIISRNNIKNTFPKNGRVSLIGWYGNVENIFAKGTTATVIDVDTGEKFKVIRTYGYNHADVETVTAKDTEILLKIAGGEWNWKRRAVLVDVKGYRIAASMAPMPHAGIDNLAANAIVDNRSGDYGRGYNLDKIKKNNMEGHFDIHFYQSRTHDTDTINEEHQKMIEKAFIMGF